ncbi:MAG: DNA recombination protein RmuC [Candidatus Cryptobacteroides sp.]
MELIISFVAGASIAAIVAVFVSRSIIANHKEQEDKLLEQAEKSQQEAIDALKQSNDEQLSSLRQSNTEQLETQRQNSSEQLETQRQSFETQLSKQKEYYESQFESLKKTSSELIESQKQSSTEQLETQRLHFESQLESLKKSSTEQIEAQKKAGEEALALQKKNSDEAIKLIQTQFEESTKALRAQLKDDTSQILKSRQEELEKSSQQNIGQILDPLKKNIEDLRKAMDEGSKEQAERNGELKERIANLMQQSDATRRSADELAKALKHGSKVQGDWGETVLNELLDSQGLTEGIHYEVQSTICDECGHPVKNATGGILRPDVILHLDTKRDLVIDSKVSLSAFIDYMNAEDEESRKTALKRHIDSLRKHVDELSKKDYASYIRADRQMVDYTIMFVPVGGALWTAMNEDKKLWREAADKKVYIADEQSLYGALRMVSLTWTQISQAENHRKVYELAEEMIERVGMFRERYDNLGNALQKVQKEYDEGKKKLEPGGASIINTSKKLIELGSKNSSKHPIKLIEE